MLKKMKILTMMRRLPEDSVRDEMDSPVGKLTLIACSEGLNALLWDEDWLCQEFMQIIQSLPLDKKNPHLTATKKQLSEYFKGKRTSFDIPLVIDGTDFQKLAWSRLREIPYGETLSYQQQAISIGGANKVRAVGSANGRNPLSIIIPCHRVIGKSGDLHGFGGGLDAKRYLIELEQSHT